jgi:adenine-specific DNA-methyltransferase
MKKLDGKSLDLKQNNIQSLKQIFPEVITEGKIDFEKLKLVLGEEIENESGKYEFTWHNKTQALKMAQTPSTGTLRPDKNSSKNWDETENLYIEGDNLEVLKLLQKSYFGKVKMIYIDPPYNTGKDFVYKDNFRNNITNYKEITKQLTVALSENSGRYHTDWLNMIYPRIKLARNLLSEDGIIFISIDDNELVNVKKVCDEIFGEKNFITIFPRVTKKGGKSSSSLAKNHDYILMYKKTSLLGIHALEHDDPNFNKSDEFLETRGMYKLNQPLDYDSLQYSSSLDYEIKLNGQTFVPGGDYEKFINRKNGVHSRADWAWRWSKKKFDFGLKNGFISVTNGERKRIYTKTYQNATISEKDGEYFIEYKKRTKPLSTLEFVNNHYSNDNATKDAEKALGGKNFFDYTKPISLIHYLTKISTSKNDIILDFFSGSATTAHAVMQLNAEDGGNRKFILVQLPELTEEKSEARASGYNTLCEIGKERIRRAGDTIAKDTGKSDLDNGFKVFKLDSSNVKSWDPDVENLEENLFNLEDNIKEDRTQVDLLFEVLLKIGLPLTTPIEEIKTNRKRIYNVAFGSVLVCLEDEIDLAVVNEMIKLKPEGFELKVIFKESGFLNDTVKTNAIQTLKKNGINDVRSV